MYSVEFSQQAEKEFNKLNSEMQCRVVSVLDRISVRPLHFVKRLVGSNYYRLRVGDYRVILDVKEDKLIIFVIELGHRSKIYD